MSKENENIVKALEAKMADCQQRFNEVETLIASIIEQSKGLQTKYDEASIKREQIRGEYTGYVNLLNEIKKNTQEQPNNIVEEEKPVKSESNKNKDTLTADEVAKLKEVTKNTVEKKTPAKKATVKKQEELPDFLKPENQPKK